jgi:hypothetical protein
MTDPNRYQQPDTDEYPHLGRLLLVLAGVAALVGLATWAATTFMSS